MQIRVMDAGDSLDPFPVSNGVKQGCGLAPTLFSIMFSAMLSEASLLKLDSPVICAPLTEGIRRTSNVVVIIQKDGRTL